MSTVPKSKRLLIPDSLRGLMLVILAFDHYGGFIGTYITYEPLGFVSAAEGFIFLAGLMLGILYVRRMGENPRTTGQKLLGRTFKIYLTYLVVMLTFMAVLWLVPSYSASWHGDELLLASFTHNLSTVIGSALIVYQPSYIGILALYVFLFLVAPVVLWLFAKGRAVLVLSVSFVLYLSQPYLLDPLFMRLFPDATYNFFTWQILFVLGIYLGHRYKTDTLQLSFRPKYLVPVLLYVVAVFVLRELFRFGLLGDYGYWVKLAFTREYLSPLRLIDFFCLAYLAFGLAQIRPQWLRNPWLIFLGQHSLYVFAYHGVVLYLVWPYIGRFNTTLESLVFVASLSIPALLHRAWQQGVRQRRLNETATSS